ncbi:transcriptional repressor [Parachitinimonas caeni]|uniref:Ferric uptake regulation protein n=1 Tax=Parachitinimonas caeni TaxID=3031301 RepID=A0ABT7DU89_9NEIS|nr:transcriptional repressor [Parachitinimonas caeni]MDK2123647.1 transcriptional repressor [Parachitinimonas caeni]
MNTETNLEHELDAAANWCLQRGEKLTDLRREVLSLLLAHDGSIKAYELLAELQKRKPTAAPPTVYRALDFLLNVGLAHKLGSLNAFVACRELDHTHHHGLMLICDRCRGVHELSDESWAERLAEDAARLGFRLSQQDIEIKGICANCQQVEQAGEA